MADWGADDAVVSPAAKRGWGASDETVTKPTAQAASAPVSDEPQVAAFDAMGNPTGGTEAAAPAPEMSYGDQMKHAGGFVDDLVRQGANGATLGFADKLAGYVNGTGAGAERALTDAAHSRTGALGDAANFGGSMLPASKIAQGVEWLGRGAQAVSPAIGKIAQNPWAQALLTGSGFGGAEAAGHDRDVATGAAIGGVAGIGGKAVADALLGGVSKAAGLANAKPLIPTTSDLRSGAQAAYKASEDAGVIATPQATQRLADNIRKEMAEFGYSKHQQPGGQAVLDEMSNLEGGNVTLKGLDVLRRVAGRMRSAEGDEGLLGSKIVNKIDDFTSNFAPGDTIGGNAPQAVKALQDARTLWQKQAKASDLEDAMAAAKNAADKAGSGGNIDNATRQKVDKILQSRNNWTPDEQAALQTIVSGTGAMQSVLRQIGKAAPSGNGLGLMLHMGAAVPSGGATIPLSIGTYAAKKAANAMTANNASYADALIRSGGDAAALKVAPNAVQRLAESKRAALAQALMRMGVGDQGAGPGGRSNQVNGVGGRVLVPSP